jgi:uncharacterized protein
MVGLGRRLRGITPVGPELPELQAVIGDADELIRSLALVAAVVTPTPTVAISRDPDDDHLVEAALAAHADAIVTGDRDLLTLGLVDQIGILPPREFLEALQPSG